MTKTVNDRAEGPSPSEIPNHLEFDRTMVRLAVPFEEKGDAKLAGAHWVGHLKTWCCRPDKVENFRPWIDGEPRHFNMLTGADVPHPEIHQ